jgi:hypothetical protein
VTEKVPGVKIGSDTNQAQATHQQHPPDTHLAEIQCCTLKVFQHRSPSSNISNNSLGMSSGLSAAFGRSTADLMKVWDDIPGSWQYKAGA